MCKYLLILIPKLFKMLPSDTAVTVEIVQASINFSRIRDGQISEYAVIEQTISPAVLSLMSEWIVNQSQ